MRSLIETLFPSHGTAPLISVGLDAELFEHVDEV
jgi:hypothetical protein